METNTHVITASATGSASAAAASLVAELKRGLSGFHNTTSVVLAFPR